jgi:hypothetical protein
MLHYEEIKCVCTNNARKISDQKRLLQINSIEQSLEKCLQEEDSKLKQNSENKILYFFSNNFIIISYIILFLFGLLFHYFFKYF